jgi:hypothetical protein
VDERALIPCPSRAELAMLNCVAESVALDAARHGASSAAFAGYTLHALRVGSDRDARIALRVERCHVTVTCQAILLGDLSR